MFPSGVQELDDLLGGGYLDNSAILIVGESQVSKEVLAYRFVRAGVTAEDACVYVTRHSPDDVKRDMKARGIDCEGNQPRWIASTGTDQQFVPDDLASLSAGVKTFLKERSVRRVRLVIDSLSSLLMVNSQDAVYRFLVQLIQDAKRYSSSLVALLEDNMHEPTVVASIEQVFDGVLTVVSGPVGQGASIAVVVSKMRGVNVASGSKIVFPLTGGTATRDTAEPDPKRVAVLPLANFSPDPNDGYFADGMTEELISTMSKIRELSVISRTSVMQYKKKPKPIVEIGRDLRVGTILEGSIRKSGNRIRVTIQMVKASTDEHLWAESYDRELQDIFAIQREIAEKVASALRVQLITSEKQDIGREPTASIDAYQLYLKGRYRFNRQTREDINASLDYFKQAVALDPNCAVAYSGISDCYHLGGHYNWFSPEEAFPIMKDYALKALEIDPRLSEAHAALGAVYFHYDWKWEEAEREFSTAIELKPSYELVFEMKSYLLAILGRFTESYQLAQRGAELSPEYLSLWLQAGFGLNRTMLPVGKIEDGIARLERIVKANPDFPLAHDCLGFAYCRASREDEGVAELRKAVFLSKSDPAMKADLALLLAHVGKKDEANSILLDLEEASRRTYLSNVQLAGILYTLGRDGEAFENLEKAYQRKSIDLPDVRIMPEMAGLRKDPRWVAIENRMGLPPIDLPSN